MNNINIIDIEASGLGFDSYPVEISVLVEGTIKTWLIKPQPEWIHWDDKAEQIHGISRDQLNKQGLSALQVLNELNDFIKESNGIIYSDAAYWDADWVDTLFYAFKEKREFHIESIYELFDEKQSGEFNKIKMNLAESGKYRQHRAEEDVKMILEAYQLIHK